jgi:hypothetical protein
VFSELYIENDLQTKVRIFALGLPRQAEFGLTNANPSYGFASFPQLLVHGVDLVDSVDLVRGEQPPACRRHAHTRPHGLYLSSPAAR